MGYLAAETLIDYLGVQLSYNLILLELIYTDIQCTLKDIYQTMDVHPLH